MVILIIPRDKNSFQIRGGSFSHRGAPPPWPPPHSSAPIRTENRIQRVVPKRSARGDTAGLFFSFSHRRADPVKTQGTKIRGICLFFISLGFPQLNMSAIPAGGPATAVSTKNGPKGFGRVGFFRGTAADGYSRRPAQNPGGGSNCFGRLFRETYWGATSIRFFSSTASVLGGRFFTTGPFMGGKVPACAFGADFSAPISTLEGPAFLGGGDETSDKRGSSVFSSIHLQGREGGLCQASIRQGFTRKNPPFSLLLLHGQERAGSTPSAKWPLLRSKRRKTKVFQSFPQPNLRKPKTRQQKNNIPIEEPSIWAGMFGFTPSSVHFSVGTSLPGKMLPRTCRSRVRRPIPAERRPPKDNPKRRTRYLGKKTRGPEVLSERSYLARNPRDCKW